MSTLPLPALGPSDWACRADPGLSGPGAPCGMSPCPCLSGQLWGSPPFLSPIWEAQNQNCLGRGQTPPGVGKPRIVPGPLSITGLTALARAMPGSPKAKGKLRRSCLAGPQTSPDHPRAKSDLQIGLEARSSGPQACPLPTSREKAL